MRNGEHVVLDARVSGSFDRRGLPDPLVVSFYFSVREGKLTQLIILRSEAAVLAPEA